MMGDNGDSNGCVSIKDYDAFLKAFQEGKVTRLAVVSKLLSPLPPGVALPFRIDQAPRHARVAPQRASNAARARPASRPAAVNRT